MDMIDVYDDVLMTEFTKKFRCKPCRRFDPSPTANEQRTFTPKANTGNSDSEVECLEEAHMLTHQDP
jgi:hypothetical protein